MEREEGEHEAENYKSIKGHFQKVEELFRAEAALGWMEEFTDEEAKRKFGKDLYVAALAVVEEPNKIRVVHDGSNTVHVNHRIRPRDQIRSPGAGELRTILRENSSSKRRLFGLAGDVSKAHRRIKIREADWGFQACRLRDGYIWVNKVGTYGMGSAAYYWARTAAALVVRLPHALMGPDFLEELALYVDDFLIIAGSQAQVEAMGLIIFILVALGTPFRWDKFRGGVEIEWIGLWTDLRGFRLGVSERRAQWMRSWLGARIRDKVVDTRDLAAVLGRLCLALGPLDHAHPFLAPAYAWLAAVGDRGHVRLPWSLLFVFAFLLEVFAETRRAVVVRPAVRSIGLAFRADAKAEGQTVCVGGWECLGDTPPHRARWFSLRLTRTSAPWAFSRGEPFRVIAALELFATLLCIVVFGGSWEGSRGGVGLSGVTDNLGNTFALAKMMTSKFPLLVILTELAAQLRSRDFELDLQWSPRDQNEEADALTNEEFSAFDPARRVTLDLATIPWLVLPGMLGAAEELYQEITKLKDQAGGAGTAAASTGGRKQRPQDKLRARDPW